MGKCILEFLWCLVNPSFWLMNHRYSAHWDKVLNELLEKHEFEPGYHTSQLGPYKIWTSNYPYAWGTPYGVGGSELNMLIPLPGKAGPKFRYVHVCGICSKEFEALKIPEFIDHFKKEHPGICPSCSGTGKCDAYLHGRCETCNATGKR